MNNRQSEKLRKKSAAFGIKSTFGFGSVQLLSRVWLFETSWIVARQASLSITISQSSLKLTTIESVMPSSHLILCHPRLLPPIPSSIRVFSNESTLRMRWPEYWSFSFNIIPSLFNNLSWSIYWQKIKILFYDYWFYQSNGRDYFIL